MCVLLELHAQLFSLHMNMFLRYKKNVRDETNLCHICPPLSTYYFRERGLTAYTHLCCLLCSFGSEQTFPQAKLLLYTFISKTVIKNFYSTRKNQSKGYQKPLVNEFTLHFKCTCGGGSAELFRFFQLVPAMVSHFPYACFL